MQRWLNGIRSTAAPTSAGNQTDGGAIGSSLIEEEGAAVAATLLELTRMGGRTEVQGDCGTWIPLLGSPASGQLIWLYIYFPSKTFQVKVTETWKRDFHDHSV